MLIKGFVDGKYIELKTNREYFEGYVVPILSKYGFLDINNRESYKRGCNCSVTYKNIKHQIVYYSGEASYYYYLYDLKKMETSTTYYEYHRANNSNFDTLLSIISSHLDSKIRQEKIDMIIEILDNELYSNI